MCLVERSRFGLNDLLGRKVSEIWPIGRASALDLVSGAALPVRKPKDLGAPRRICLRGRTPQQCFRPRARAREFAGATREQGNDAGRSSQPIRRDGTEAWPDEERDVALKKAQQKLLAA